MKVASQIFIIIIINSEAQLHDRLTPVLVFTSADLFEGPVPPYCVEAGLASFIGVHRMPSAHGEKPFKEPERPSRADSQDLAPAVRTPIPV
jgi:hypothetical protein